MPWLLVKYQFQGNSEPKDVPLLKRAQAVEQEEKKAVLPGALLFWVYALCSKFIHPAPTSTLTTTLSYPCVDLLSPHECLKGISNLMPKTGPWLLPTPSVTKPVLLSVCRNSTTRKLGQKPSSPFWASFSHSHSQASLDPCMGPCRDL